jgi:VIT1/CCC1 family predicted Fe2+/Mn2+ transporter
MLNIAGSEYDYAQVVYVVLQECEHRRRGFEEETFDHDVRACAAEKMAEIKAAYDEFGGSAPYWEALDKEVEEVVVPQYLACARAETELERNDFYIWRGGDLAARFVFALIGLFIGSIIIALPFVPIFEDMFAIALMVAGFIYPDLKRFMFERRYMKVLNRIVSDSARYQDNAKLHYMTSNDIQKSFEPGNPRRLPP